MPIITIIANTDTKEVTVDGKRMNPVSADIILNSIRQHTPIELARKALGLDGGF